MENRHIAQIHFLSLRSPQIINPLTNTHMIIQLENSGGNVLAVEIVDGYTESDEKLFQKLFQERINEGHEHINILVKLDELKISNVNTKAFFKDILFDIRNYKKMGNIAIVAQSGVIKALVPIDNFFFKLANKGFQERYFDVSKMEDAKAFVHG